jgi:transketolase
MCHGCRGCRHVEHTLSDRFEQARAAETRSCRLRPNGQAEGNAKAQYSDLPAEKLLQYREFGSGLPGHPEKLLTPGVEFSSGRLGHLWAFCNGVAMANRGKAVILLGSDGSEMEGDNAEAARLAVGKQLNVKVLVDDNNVTISGHPQEYMVGSDLTRTLAGYGLQTETTMGEDLDALYVDLCRVFCDQRPHALIVKRAMAPGIEGAEGSPKAHEVLEAKMPVIAAMSRSHCEEGQCRSVTSSSKSIVGHLAQFRARCGIGQHEERIP